MSVNNVNYEIFQNYLIKNENWLTSEGEEKGKHATNGILEQDELNIFFQKVGLDDQGNFTKFDQWWANNTNEETGCTALNVYFASLGITDLEEAKEMMKTSMTEYATHLASESGLGAGVDTFSLMEDWEDAHAEAMQLGDNDEFIYDESLGLSFDFMEGRDINDEQAYNEQTLKLGAGEVAAKDAGEKDGKISFEEYFTAETSADVERYKAMIAAGELDEDTVVEFLMNAYVAADAVFKSIDGGLGFDDIEGKDDGYLTAEELQRYYQRLDEYAGEGEEAQRGTIDITHVSDYPMSLAMEADTSNLDLDAIREYVKGLLAQGGTVSV